MAVETSKARRAQQSEMADLQSEYAKKKKQYSQQQESELDGLKEFYNQRKEETRDQGEAAVNHIRSKQSENMKTITDDRRKITERSEQQLASIDDNYRRKIVESQSKRQAQIDTARETGNQKVAEIEQAQGKKLDKVRSDANMEVQGVKTKFKKDLQETQAFTDKRMDEIKAGNERTMNFEIEKGRNTQEKLRANIKQDYDKATAHGNHMIAERKDLQEKKLQRQDNDYEHRVGKNKEQWTHREKSQDDMYKNRLGLSKKAYEQQLKDQNKQFKSTFDKTQAANKQSLEIQNNNYLKEQIELKKKFFQSNEKYSGKEDDPFYKIEDRGNRLRENSDFYIIEAYVPEHEKDSLKVTIKDDSASISGKRAFKDQIEEEGRKLSTSNYQSFREEFSFEKPVITEGMTRERNGDYITFWVPKLNSFDGVRKLSKKA